MQNPNIGKQTVNQQQQTFAAPNVQEPARTIVHAPLVEETIRNDRVVEVQPVVHREVDQNVVHHIEKHIQEPHAPSMGGVFERPALVEQQVHTNVVNEIQPVIHRERVVPVAERVEQHMTQRVVEPTIHTHEVVYENAPMGTTGVTGVAPVATTTTTTGVAPVAQPHHKHGLFHRH